MTTTPRIGAPLLVAGQALPETTVDEMAYLFDAFVCPHFKDRDLSAPPGSPAQGDCYLVAAAPTGAWTGQVGKVAIYINTAWSFVAAKEGFLFWVDDENVLILYDGAAWNVVGVSTGAFLQVANNLSDVASAATSRTNLGLGTAATTALDTDVTLAANSDTRVASQKAVKTAIANAVTGLLDWQGSQDCSGNPNYPAASKGDAYIVSVAGKIGGAAGLGVDVGDVFFALADNAGGTQAGVGASWDVLEHNLVGALVASNNLSELASAATARTNLGATTVGGNIFTLADPGAITFLRLNADNTVSALSAAAFRTAIGAGTGSGSGDLVAANNLSDVASAATSRTNLGLGTAATATVDNDTTLAGDSTTNVPSQHAVKTAIANAVTGLLDWKGSQDCSANPNYPAASKGDAYIVSVAGKIGGASGLSVDVGDVFFALADNAGGTQAGVGASWDVLEHNLVGALLAANNLSDVASAATARANLGLAIGSDIPARNPSVQAVASSATVTPTFADDMVKVTAQAVALNLANPTGTAVPGWGLVIRIKDNGTARAITYGTQYRAIGVTLPTTTVISKTLYLGLIYNADDTKWDVVAVAQEA